jgi:hypothetical protein
MQIIILETTVQCLYNPINKRFETVTLYKGQLINAKSIEPYTGKHTYTPYNIFTITLDNDFYYILIDYYFQFGDVSSSLNNTVKN